MFLINLETSDPCFNLALEEVLLKSRMSDYLILYINDPAVIIGKHQAAHREVNTKFITENKIPVIRRISGGGTVFHDRGNLNFTFIRQSEEGKQIDFRKYTLPVIDFLSSLGIDAKFEGKNDIKVDGLKISGNAEHVYRNRILHHGTLLFSSSIEFLKNSIRSDKSGYTTRAVDSNSSPVMNLSEKLKIFKDINEFSKELRHYFSAKIPDLAVTGISGPETEEAASLAETRYRKWEWNFAYGPEYVFKNTFMFDGEPHCCTLQIKDGIVIKCAIDGSDKMKSASEKLQGLRHMVADFLNMFEKENILISEEEIFNFF
jgi:lipoate-protein ligase A